MAESFCVFCLHLQHPIVGPQTKLCALYPGKGHTKGTHTIFFCGEDCFGSKKGSQTGRFGPQKNLAYCLYPTLGSRNFVWFFFTCLQKLCVVFLHMSALLRAQCTVAPGRKPEPVQVMVNRGYVGVFVTVSDHGGGNGRAIASS